MIEVQIISKGTENHDLVNQCLSGLDSPAATMHLGEAIEDNLNAARIAVWDQCGGDLLSFVDPEDIPDASAWQKLQNALDSNPKAMGAFTLEQTISQSGALINFTPKWNGKDPFQCLDFPRHILVVRRSIYELVKPYAQGEAFGIERLLASAAFNRGGLICIPEFLYKQRRHTPSRSSRVFPAPDKGQEFLTWLKAQT